MLYIRWRRRLMSIALLALLLSCAPYRAAQAQTGERCFSETNQCISGAIRAYWERNGGLPIFGYPVSPLRTEDVEGKPFPVQWFERDRLEDHGAEGVMAGRLGARALELKHWPWEYFDKAIQADLPAGCELFAQTSHSLCEPFLGYWRANGGLSRLGYPVTELFNENGFRVQYFERRRMEIHPELQGSPVLLGLLGNEVLSLTASDAGARYPGCLSSAPQSLMTAISLLHFGAPIGCPQASWTALPAATQAFEQGTMIWLSERTHTWPMNYPPTILAAYGFGPNAGSYSDTWVAGQDPDTPPDMPPHAGLYAPWRGFGKVWAQERQLREEIGWATQPQALAYTVDAAMFDTAFLVRINETGVVYAFGNADAKLPPVLIARP